MLVCETLNYLGAYYPFGEHLEINGKIFHDIRSPTHLSVICPDIVPTVIFQIFETQIQLITAFSSEVCYNRQINPGLERTHPKHNTFHLR